LIKAIQRTQWLHHIVDAVRGQKQKTVEIFQHSQEDADNGIIVMSSSRV